jgi:uncharacterized protein YdeI (YjbR/CyaY-like superfamily)
LFLPIANDHDSSVRIFQGLGKRPPFRDALRYPPLGSLPGQREPDRMKAKPKKELPQKAFKSQQDWEAWLERHHESPGIWVKLAKKGSGVASVSYQEAVDSALCFGWIDGMARSLDDTFYLQRFTPRAPKSNWTQTNRAKAESFIAEGRMRPSGLRAVEAAKAGGRWK